jgi:hypothetical protein
VVRYTSGNNSQKLVMSRAVILLQWALAILLWHAAAGQSQDVEAAAYLEGRGPLYHTASQLNDMFGSLAQRNNTHIRCGATCSWTGLQPHI